VLRYGTFPDIVGVETAEIVIGVDEVSLKTSGDE
jgi:hypothetical protein